MTFLTRRHFGQMATSLAVAALGMSRLRGQTAKVRKFTMDLCPGRLGVSVGQLEAISLAGKFGFESVEPFGNYLADLPKSALDELLGKLKENNLVWGAGGFNTDFRGDELRFKESLSELPKVAEGYKAAGVTRVGTWISPASDDLTYTANFKQHARRLNESAKILGDHGLRLGLEYVGPRTLWASRRYPFLHSLAESLELLDAIGQPNVGVILDSWHWYTAEETTADLLGLSAEKIVAVDLNDAPAGIDVRDQIDNKRELPKATGVIDVKAFLSCLLDLGYDGPVRAEPFNQVLNDMDNEPAVEATAQALRKAFDTVS